MSLQTSHYINDHRTLLDGNNLKCKRVGDIEIVASRELKYFFKWLTPDQASQDGYALAI